MTCVMFVRDRMKNRSTKLFLKNWVQYFLEIILSVFPVVRARSVFASTKCETKYPSGDRKRTRGSAHLLCIFNCNNVFPDQKAAGLQFKQIGYPLPGLQFQKVDYNLRNWEQDMNLLIQERTRGSYPF